MLSLNVGPSAPRRSVQVDQPLIARGNGSLLLGVETDSLTVVMANRVPKTTGAILTVPHVFAVTI